MDNFKSYTDLELSFLLKSDNKDVRKKAFDEIYDRYSAAVYTYCIKFMKNNEVAKDVFQDTFVRFFDYVQTKNEGIEKIGGFLIKIARNLCLNIKSDKKHSTVDINQVEISLDEDTYEKKQNREILIEALNKLPAKYRELIILKEFLNYTYNDIAEITEQSRNNVGIMLHRAKQMLKEIVLKIHKLPKIEIEDENGYKQ